MILILIIAIGCGVLFVGGLLADRWDDAHVDARRRNR